MNRIIKHLILRIDSLSVDSSGKASTELQLGLSLVPHPAGHVVGHHAGQCSQQEGPTHLHQFSPIKYPGEDHPRRIISKLIRELTGTWQEGWLQSGLGA